MSCSLTSLAVTRVVVGDKARAALPRPPRVVAGSGRLRGAGSKGPGSRSDDADVGSCDGSGGLVTKRPATSYRTVSKASPIPRYYQVESDLRQRIESGEWQAGAQIPTEAQLCSLYGTSRVTIRQALSKLVSEGLLLREQGRGTYVREQRITAGGRTLTSFTEEVAKLGRKPGSRVLSLKAEPCPGEVARQLQIEEGSAVVTVRRLRLSDGHPLAIQTAYLPSRRFPGLETFDLADRSLYATLAEVFDVHPTEAEETFEVGPILGNEARLLEVRAGSCGFRAQRLTFDTLGPFELAQSLLRGDRYSLRIGLIVPPKERS